MNDTAREPAKWWVLGALLVLLAGAMAAQRWREAARHAEHPPVVPLHPRYRVGQQWSVRARLHEDAATATVVSVERSSRDELLVHVRVDGVKLQTRQGPLGNIAHLPLTAAAFDASIVDLLQTAAPLGNYADPLWRWRTGYDAGRWPAITTNLRDGVELTERSMNR